MELTAASPANTIVTSKRVKVPRRFRLTIFPAKSAKDEDFAIKPGEEYGPHERHKSIADDNYSRPPTLGVFEVR